ENEMGPTESRSGILLRARNWSACCAVGFNRDFYMGPHQDWRGGRRPFFHSAYFSGKPVLFAGGMVIQKGRLKMINAVSGHYCPRPEHMVSVLEALLMHGVSLVGVTVSCMQIPWLGYHDARDFLARRGRFPATRPVRWPPSRPLNEAGLWRT